MTSSFHLKHILGLSKGLLLSELDSERLNTELLKVWKHNATLIEGDSYQSEPFPLTLMTLQNHNRVLIHGIPFIKRYFTIK